MMIIVCLINWANDYQIILICLYYNYFDIINNPFTALHSALNFPVLTLERPNFVN